MFDSERGPIHYLMVYSDRMRENFSYRTGFSVDALSLAPLLHQVLLWPQNYRELFATREELVEARVAGLSDLHVEPVTAGRLRERLADGGDRLWCVVSRAEIAREVREVLRTVGFPVLHVSAAGAGGDLSYEQVGRPSLARFVARFWLHAAWTRPGGKGRAKAILDAWLAGRKLVRRATPLPRMLVDLVEYDADVIGPAGVALTAAGLSAARRGDAANLTEPDLPGLAHAYLRAVRAERERVLASGALPLEAVATGLVIGAPAMLRERYEGGARLRPELRRAEEGAEALLRAMREQRTYTLRPPAGFLERPPSELAGGILHFWSLDQAAFTTVLAALASTRFAPVMPLPPAVNHARRAAELLGAWTRPGERRPDGKLSEAAARLGAELKGAIPPELRGEIDSAAGHVKILADAPLEWTEACGFPLMLRAVCSRIPATPGDLSLELALRPTLEVPASAFAEILVVRALEPADPLYGVLRAALEGLADDGVLVHTRLRFVDVGTRDELADAFRAFRGAMVIVEGHGHRAWLRKPHPFSKERGDLAPGTLEIGGEPIELWTLPDDVRVPPVVVLSSCDTHALDGHHASVASAFLKAGAATVIATALPVLGGRAAEFARRLVLQLETLREDMARRRHWPVRWAAFAAVAQRTCYVEEMLERVLAAGGPRLEPAARDEVVVAAFGRILRHEPGWLDAVFADVAGRAGVEPGAVRERAARRAYYTDSLAYLQLGNPERVGIFPDDHPRVATVRGGEGQPPAGSPRVT